MCFELQPIGINLLVIRSNEVLGIKALGVTQELRTHHLSQQLPTLTESIPYGCGPRQSHKRIFCGIFCLIFSHYC